MRRNRPSSTGIFSHTIEEFDWQGDCLDLEVTVGYEIDEYDPGYRYDRNGDGCPPSGGGVYPGLVRVISVTGDDDHGRRDGVSVRERVAIQADLNRRLDLAGKNPLRDNVVRACEEDASDRWSDGRDDGDEAYERARDERDMARFQD